mgnify:CR=1 FL=1
MATNRITYGQSAIAVSQPPANSDNTSNLTGLKRVQSASVDFAFARERFKQIGSPDYVGQVQVKNADIFTMRNHVGKAECYKSFFGVMLFPQISQCFRLGVRLWWG